VEWICISWSEFVDGGLASGHARRNLPPLRLTMSIFTADAITAASSLRARQVRINSRCPRAFRDLRAASCQLRTSRAPHPHHYHHRRHRQPLKLTTTPAQPPNIDAYLYVCSISQRPRLIRVLRRVGYRRRDILAMKWLSSTQYMVVVDIDVI